jgi:predicted RNase H-like HicB family nuclease
LRLKKATETKSDYHINIFFSKEDAGYIADIPDLKSCSAWGKTPQEALKQVLIARDLWLASMREQGKRVPKPRYRPMIYQSVG